MTRNRLHGLGLITITAVALGIGAALMVRVSPRREALEIRPLGMRTARARTIRVCLTPSHASRVNVEVNGPFRIVPVGSAQVLSEGKRLAPVRISTSGRTLQLGERVLSASQIEIVPQEPALVWCEGHGYRGALRIQRASGGALVAINVVPLESYVASVVDSEMPAAFGVEARKAQAIVARGYALSQMRAAPSEAQFDLYSNTRSQNYLGCQYRDSAGKLLAGESEESRRIISETAGLVCTYQGRLFCPYYSATCGGRTLVGTELFADAAPPLQSVVCRWCQPAPSYRWEGHLSKRNVEERLQVHFARERKFGTLRSLNLAGPVPPGRLPQFTARDEFGTRSISGQELRTLLGSQQLHSPRFTVETAGETIKFRGQGSGHGAGLCQWGARGMAAEGLNAQQILAHYYPGSKIASVDGK